LPGSNKFYIVPYRILSAILCLSTLSVLLSCQSGNTEQVEGDLYFKLIDPIRHFEAPDTVLNRLERQIENNDVNVLSPANKKHYGMLKFMVNHNFLKRPFIRLIDSTGRSTMFFLDWTSYKRFETYRLGELETSNTRIHVRLRGTPVLYDTQKVYNVVDIIKIDTLQGATRWGN